MKVMPSARDRGLKSDRYISTNYRFYGLSVSVRSMETEFDKNIIDRLDSIYSHFIAEGGEADLIVDLTGELQDQQARSPERSRGGRRNIFAFARSGLNCFGFDESPIAELISSSSDRGRTYRIIGGSGFYELLKSSYYTILSFVLANLDGFLQVHAGAVARDKAGIVIPGGSGSGKTTLALTLVNSGYSFLSDEICLIDSSDLMVYPFPRSLFLRDDVIDLFSDLAVGRYSGDIYVMQEKKCLIEVADNSICPEDSPKRVNLILFPNYRPHEKARIKDVSGTEALARLVAAGSVLNMSHPGIDHGSMLDYVFEMIGSISCLELTYSRTEDAVRVIDGLVS